MSLPTEVDVLIVGGGLAGVTALLRSVELGQSVLLIEKTSELGGSTVKSRAGITDSNELLSDDLLTTGRHQNNPTLVTAYCEEQFATYRWLQEHGVHFGEPHAGSGQSVPRSHGIDTVGTLRLLSSKALAGGGAIALDTSARDLLFDEGTVVGAVVLHQGTSVEISARSVILTSGGFSRSEELLAEWAPAMAKAVREGGIGNTGDGLKMGIEAGAGLADMNSIKGTFGRFPWRSPAEDGAGILVVYKGAIAVNGAGKRFIDESLPYKVIGDACLAQPEAIAFQIFDAPILAHGDESVPIYSFQRRLDAGQIQQANSIEELADKLGLESKELVATVTAYNEAIEHGEHDEMGRSTLVGGVGIPTALETPPFYGYPSTTTVLSTYCGLAINADSQVLDHAGKPLPGLLAAGEVTGGFHGDGYVTGSSLGKSAIFGRIAATSALATKEQ